MKALFFVEGEDYWLGFVRKGSKVVQDLIAGNKNLCYTLSVVYVRSSRISGVNLVIDSLLCR